MTRKAFIEKILNIKLFANGTLQEKELGCFGFDCEGKGCDQCSHKGFWNEEVSLAELYANLSVSDAGKAICKGLLNSMYGSVNTGRCNGRTHAIERSIELSGWNRFPRILDTLDFDSIRDIVNDALDNGFEFKVYNSTLYYREKDYANTDSTQDVD